MVILYVTYAGDAQTRFDRDYWLNKHLPLVRACWSQYGLERTDGFFPAGRESGLIAICPCIFRDEAAMHAALASPETRRIVEDVRNVTDAEPVQSVAYPVKSQEA